MQLRPSRILTHTAIDLLCLALDSSVAGSAFMRGIFSSVRVTQEGPDGLSHYCPVRVICQEIQLCFLTGVLSWLIASFTSADYTLDGMTSTLINDDSRYWLRIGDGLHSVAVTLNGYAALYAKYSTAMQPKHAWIRGLLPATWW